MRHRKKMGLHVVRDEEEMLINRLINELDDEDMTSEEQAKQHQEKKKKSRKRKLRIAVVAAAAVVGIALLLIFSTYKSGNTVVSYHTEAANNNSYHQFAKGVLKYSRDGIAYLNKKSEEIWNHPYQIKNPMIEVYNETAVVADKGGNTIVVFDDEGVKGNVQTALPIEKVSVSEQGVVCALLKNENSPKIICYDAAGNILAEIKTAFSATGYPMDVSISEDGTLLLVPYMYIENGMITTKIVFYNFAGETSANKEYEIVSDSFENMMAPTAFFMNETISAVIGDDRILIYNKKEKPELSQTIMLDKEIKSVFHDDKYIGLILKNEGKAGYELGLYNTSGKKVLSREFTGDYANVKISEGKIFMYDGKKCSIFTRWGLHRFDGELNGNILEIFPTTGLNKYVVMSENGMEIIRLAR